MNRILMTGLIACAFVLPLAAEDAAAPADPTPTPEEEAAPVKKKKLPKKLPEYKSWGAAAAAAEAWEQPILALIEVAGDKSATKIKTATIASQPFQKEFIPANVIYLHSVLPAIAKNNQSKDDPLEPDLRAIKNDEERISVSRLMGAAANSKPALPMVVLADYTGRVHENCLFPMPEDAQLGKFVDAVKSAMDKGKFETKISPRLQKAIDKETKALEKAAKRAKK